MSWLPKNLRFARNEVRAAAVGSHSSYSVLCVSRIIACGEVGGMMQCSFADR